MMTINQKSKKLAATMSAKSLGSFRIQDQHKNKLTNLTVMILYGYAVLQNIKASAVLNTTTAFCNVSGRVEKVR